MKKEGKLLVIDLFCGAGGLSEGFKMAGFHILAANEIEPVFCETYEKNHPETKLFRGDIRNITVEEFKKKCGIDGIKVDAIIGGPPCQGFSMAGKRDSGDPRNSLFKDFVRFVRELKPKFFVMENVKGILSSKTHSGEKVKDIIVEEFYNLGYEVYEPTILNAAGYGVPQKRERVFFIGHLPGYDFKFPSPTHRLDKEDLNQTTLTELKNPVTVWEALSDLPPVEPHKEKGEYLLEPKSEFQELMRIENPSLTSHIAPKHPTKTIEDIKKVKPGESLYKNFRQRIRLHPNKIAPTLVCQGPRPQFSHAHPFQDRGLTPRERARIQGFPDYYQFTGGIVQQRVQTGNAVPPLLAKAIANEIINSLKKWKEQIIWIRGKEAIVCPE